MSHEFEGQRHERTSLILYGSETGNGQDAAEQLGRNLERLRFATTVVEMDSVEIKVLMKFSVVIFVISTTGQGDIPANARRFWKSLLRKRLPRDCLNHVPFTTFGFGDSSYVKFNWAARKLNKRLEQLGANEIYPPGEADEQHPEGTDGAFLPWCSDVRLHLLKQFPLPEGELPIPDSELLPPHWTVTLAESLPDPITATTPTSPTTPRQRVDSASPSASPALPSQQGLVSKMDGPITKLLRLTDAVVSGADVVQEKTLPPQDLLPVPDCLTVTCEKNTRLTQRGHWQDVRSLSFLVDGNIKYRPGDVVTIYPKNFPEDVDSLIELQGWTDVADKPIIICPTAESYGKESYIPRVAAMRTVDTPTLRSLLINNLDIRAIPRRYFFEIISKFTDDPLHRERLLDFTNPVYSDEFFDYTSRPRRSILEVLHDFPSVRIPWHWAPSVFPELRGRQFSIASGGDIMTPEADTTRIQICVALVKYQTVLRKTRQGVCSRYLASLPVGTELNVSLTCSDAFLVTKEKLEKPIVMIAPGTGVAPMRNLIWTRALWVGNKEIDPAKALLIFGGRNAKADFLFEKEWKSANLDVKVVTAFSRDQKEKRYVQDAIRDNSRLICELLADLGGSVYVCGSSGKMPVSVRAALVDAFHDVRFREDYNYTKEQAEAEVALMEKQGRYIQETW